MRRVLHSTSTGFTILELVVTMFVLGVLFGVSVLVAHEKDYAPQMRDAQRQVDVASLLQAIVRYKVATGGLPPGLEAKPKAISSQPDDLQWCGVVFPAYLKQIPLDPAVGGSLEREHCAEKNIYTAGYTVQLKADGTVTVAAPITDADKDISVSRKL